MWPWPGNGVTFKQGMLPERAYGANARLACRSPKLRKRTFIVRYLARHGCSAMLVGAVTFMLTAMHEALGQEDPVEGPGRAASAQPTGARRRYGPLEVIAESIFGSGTDEP